MEKQTTQEEREERAVYRRVSLTPVYKCLSCEYITDIRKNMAKHYDKEHPLPKKRICCYCRTRHTDNEDCPPPQQEEWKGFKCGVCGKHYKTHGYKDDLKKCWECFNDE